MKTCTQCKITKEQTEFSKKRQSTQSICKLCARQNFKIYYHSNREEQRKRVTKQKRNIRSWLINYKQDKHCEHCFENHVSCLDFHHRDPKEKKFSIAEASTYGFSISKILEEIAKCQILCKNCHAKLHYQKEIDQKIADQQVLDQPS